MKKTIIWVMFWWFVAVSEHGTPGMVVMVGPFQTQEDCDKVRTWMAQRREAFISPWCWWTDRGPGEGSPRRGLLR